MGRRSLRYGKADRIDGYPEVILRGGAACLT
jgi:hypothetical protein